MEITAKFSREIEGPEEVMKIGAPEKSFTFLTNYRFWEQNVKYLILVAI